MFFKWFSAVSVLSALLGQLNASEYWLNVTHPQGVTNIFQKSSNYMSGYRKPVLKICYTGMWILYSDIDYLGGSAILLNANELCIDQPPNTYLRSVRTVGLPDMSLPSATFFSGKNYEDQVQVIDGAISAIDFPIESLITIGTNVELFKELNHSGDSFCVELCKGFTCWSDECYAWNWDEVQNAPWDPRLAKSAKIGCTPVKKNNGNNLSRLIPNPKPIICNNTMFN